MECTNKVCMLNIISEEIGEDSDLRISVFFNNPIDFHAT